MLVLGKLSFEKIGIVSGLYKFGKLVSLLIHSIEVSAFSCLKTDSNNFFVTVHLAMNG
jgi:hypothetical protein